MVEAIRKTPEQESMEKEQERVRKQGYDRELANKGKPPLVPQFADPFIFRMKMWKNGPFSGLWQLEALNSKGQVEQLITDAETLPNVLELMGNIFANKGF